eukprot:CAMPEP_0174244554 /NCGR_PEP_ID=MMETSP0417-20130205/35616_1 /TAXON_ID=242541 /ORGANISM="Mayorella sp, Strain BSH-02190019" /LENGTH=523 /DNA_ID=CAMNT_0015324247 /DNA_START=27 /DNA_END=1595 /DNA_ORIENTATION=+
MFSKAYRDLKRRGASPGVMVAKDVLSVLEPTLHLEEATVARIEVDFRTIRKLLQSMEKALRGVDDRSRREGKRQLRLSEHYLGWANPHFWGSSEHDPPDTNACTQLLLLLSELETHCASLTEKTHALLWQRVRSPLKKLDSRLERLGSTARAWRTSRNGLRSALTRLITFDVQTAIAADVLARYRLEQAMESALELHKREVHQRLTLLETEQGKLHRLVVHILMTFVEVERITTANQLSDLHQVAGELEALEEQRHLEHAQEKERALTERQRDETRYRLEYARRYFRMAEVLLEPHFLSAWEELCDETVNKAHGSLLERLQAQGKELVIEEWRAMRDMEVFLLNNLSTLFNHLLLTGKRTVGVRLLDSLAYLHSMRRLPSDYVPEADIAAEHSYVPAKPLTLKSFKGKHKSKMSPSASASTSSPSKPRKITLRRIHKSSSKSGRRSAAAAASSPKKSATTSAEAERRNSGWSSPTSFEPTSPSETTVHHHHHHRNSASSDRSSPDASSDEDRTDSEPERELDL